MSSPWRGSMFTWTLEGTTTSTLGAAPRTSIELGLGARRLSYSLAR
jgi:hypothetical protein